MPVLLALLLLASADAGAPAPDGGARETPVVHPPLPDPTAKLDHGLGKHPAGPARAEWASGIFLGAPYVLSPLGEGAGLDKDPRFRLDSFDCVTYVETVVALANVERVEDAKPVLDDVRYGGPPAFDHRNHYMLAQWIPHNVAKGWVKDATAAIAGPLATVAKKKYDAKTWEAAKKSGHLVPGLSEAAWPKGEVSFSMVPIDKVPQVAGKIPAGTILLVIREDRPSRPYRVTHLGIVVVGKDGERRIRHASDVPASMHVREEGLAHFLERNSRYEWPVSGVALFEIADNREHARGLTAPGASSPPEKSRPAVKE